MTTETIAIVKKPALSDIVLAAQKKLYDAITVDSTTGIITTAPDAVAEILYSNGVTKEVADQYEANIETVLAAGTHAFGQRSVEAYQANADLQTTETVMSMHNKNKFSLSSVRSKEYRNIQDPEKPITKHAVISYDYETVYDKNIGQLKIARGLINDLGAEKLK